LSHDGAAMKGKRRDLGGQKFGFLTVLPQTMRAVNRHYMWLCRCDCGARAWKRSDRLVQGRVKSCGYDCEMNGKRQVQDHDS